MASTTRFHGFVSCVLILLRIPLSPLFLVHLVYILLLAYLPVNIVLLSCIYLYCTLDAIILFFHFLYLFSFLHDHGVYGSCKHIFFLFILSLLLALKGILLLRCLSCILTLRICFMSAAGVVDYNLYMQAGDSWLCELLYELLLRHFCWCASIGGNSIGKERKVASTVIYPTFN